MNSIPFALHWAFHKLFTWFDNELSLRVAVITGEGKKAGLKMGPSSVLPADILEQDLRC
ncbi:carnitinyl-dehydratase [Lasallia pustulata]|uniref:Carnitinyl-dehydratase n=1 Tax=Lasallia pustulata TaxID=136370 RepID=A0A1W5D7J1_9LECA|nr:carnitinyl-dehydratase [Lasallia pustulata]